MFKGIKNLYVVNGKLVFRAHFREKGREKYVWKTIGKPGDFTTKELEKIVSALMKNLVEKNQVKREKENIFHRKELSLFSGYRTKLEETKSSTKSPTLGEIIEKFLTWYKNVREFASYRRHKVSSKHIIKFFGSNTPLEKINNGKVEEYKLWRKEQGVSPVTINKELRFLATMINRAVEFEWIPQHKLYRKAILIKGVENKRLRYLSKNEEKRLIEAIKCPLLKDIVIFALNTGLRKEEILSLKWSNIDFETRCVILEPYETKNKKRHILPLNSKAWQVIKRRFKQRAEGCPYVFHRNGRKVNSIRTAFENALKRAGIKDFHFHDLRHTFASRLVQKGADLYVVKELLNHSDITTTQRYAHLRLDNLKKAVEKLP